MRMRVRVPYCTPVPVQRSIGIGNLELFEIFSSNRYSNFLSTISFVLYLNPVGWPALLVGMLHKTLYVLYSLVNSKKKIHSNRVLVSLDSHYFFTRSNNSNNSSSVDDDKSRRIWTLIYIAVNTKMWIDPLWVQQQLLMKMVLPFVVPQEKKLSEYHIAPWCTTSSTIHETRLHSH